MAEIIEVCDLEIKELDVYTRLTEAHLRDKQSGNGLFIAESHKVIAHALDAGIQPVSFLMGKKHIENQGRVLLDRCPDVPVYTAESALLEKLTGYKINRGMLCAMKRPPEKSAEEICQGARRIAVLDGIVDPSNVGAIFRAAAALGMDALLLAPNCCDPLYRKAIRVSMGTVFQVPWARLGRDTGQWLHNGVDKLREMGFKTAALALDERAVSVENEGLINEKRLALLLGTEGDGLAPAVIENCDYSVMIPMSHGVDSLNVAAAAAVAFWQLRVR